MALAKVQVIQEIFSAREATLNSLPDFYKISYNYILNEKKRQMDLLESAIDRVMAYLSQPEMDSELKGEVLNELVKPLKDMLQKLIG